MKKYENQCCDCAVAGYPCLGSSCSLRKVPIHYCDRCESEIDEIFDVEGEELCEDCLKDLFRRDDA